LESHIKI
jgi:hypothetical protein